MPTRYWIAIFTYILMHASGFIFLPLIYNLLPFSQFQAGVFWNVFSFSAALLIIWNLLEPDRQMRHTREGAGPGQIILWSIIGLFMAYLSQYIAIEIEARLFDIKPGSENTGEILDISRNAPIFLIVPMIIAPILEEVIFRKIIFGQLHKRMNFFIAALLSSFIFGIIHGEPEHILIYGSMGFVFAFLYVKTKRIIVPIIVHGAMNSITIIIQLSIGPEEIERMQRQLEEMVIFIGI